MKICALLALVLCIVTIINGAPHPKTYIIETNDAASFGGDNSLGLESKWDLEDIDDGSGYGCDYKSSKPKKGPTTKPPRTLTIIFKTTPKPINIARSLC